MASDFVKNCKGLSGLSACKIKPKFNLDKPSKLISY